MIFRIFYDIGLHLYACASLFGILLKFGKYRNTLLKRLGIGFPSIEKKGRKLFWVHAVSLGETKAVIPLLKKLKSSENPPLILLSTTTKTGYEEGLKNAPTDFHVFLPFDFSYIIRPIVKRVKPDVVVLTETDFWFHFQDASKKVGAKVIVINGKISNRSFKRFARLIFFSKHLLGTIDHFYLQGELYRRRFESLQISSTILTVTGNIKCDSAYETHNISTMRKQWELFENKSITFGSTHDPEEKIIISTLKQLWKDFPNLKAFIAPRHPERFDTVAKYLENAKLPFSRWSEELNLNGKNVVLVDVMGALRTCYQIADIAFVGGSLTSKIGGHNILEPAFYGKPVLFGPFMHSQPDLHELVTTFRAGLQVTEKTLLPTLYQLLSNQNMIHDLGTNGKKLISTSRGALDTTFFALLSLL